MFSEKNNIWKYILGEYDNATSIKNSSLSEAIWKKTASIGQKDNKNYTYEILCEYHNHSVVGETKWPLDLRIKEHRRNTIRR